MAVNIFPEQKCIGEYLNGQLYYTESEDKKKSDR
jgi:hypothetical protein